MSAGPQAASDTMGVMKKLVASVILVAALALTGCSAPGTGAVSSSPAGTARAEPVQEIPKVPDLTGDWTQSNSNSETDFMTAAIADGVISVNWVLGSEDLNAVFWVGTFESPTSATETHTWSSQRDVAATETALLASSEDAKEFTYGNDIISFTVSLQGESATVELKKN